MKNIHKNVATFCCERHSMPIIWLILHNFGVIIVVVVQRNQFN